MRVTVVMAQMINLLSTFFALTITYILFCKVRSELQIAPGTTYDELYTSAIDRYNEENWDDTIFYMENAIREFKFYRVRLAECRTKCQSISEISLPDEDPMNELKFFHTIFKKAACLRTCKSAKLGDRQNRISDEATNKFLTLMPYSYLQFAYYKQKKYFEAQCAAYTYLKAHPSDDVMRNNLAYYYNVYGAENETIVDREERRHQKHFLSGNAAHEESNFTGVIEEFELALEYYWWAEEECRALCEGQYDSREFLDLYESIAGHLAYSLHCKEQCDDHLATLDAEVVPDYLPLHFHYLQYAYYKVNKIAEAVDCAATYLLLKPTDVDMVRNMEYYESELGVSKYQVRDRPKVQAYVDRQQLEKEILQFARTYFWEEDEDEDDGEGSYGSAEPINPREVRLKEGMNIEYLEDEEDDDDDEEDVVLAAKKKRGDIGSVFEKGQDDDLVEEEETDDKEAEEDDYDYDYPDDDDDLEEEELDDDYFEPERPDITLKRKKRAEERRARMDQEGDDSKRDAEAKYYDEFRTERDKGKEEELEKKLEVRAEGDFDAPRRPRGPGEGDNNLQGLTEIYQSTFAFNTLKELASETSRVPYPSLAEIELHKDPVALKGKSRVAVDGMASEDECQTLVKLITEEATLGDGYKGRSKPFSQHEQFEGVTVKDAVDAASADRMPLYYPATFIYLAERARAFVQQFFGLKTHLYFSFTHLVCRQAKRGSPIDRDDLSHPVHADNCIVDHKRNICHKQDPAFTWRDYSSLLYLNSEFEGGNFMFANYDNTSQVEVEPKCGRLVAFSGENLHGVRPVVRGQRCALAMWYTLDPLHQELDMALSWSKIGKLLEESKQREAYQNSGAEADGTHGEL